ncbi:MAG: putative sulfate exporter family transporter [Cyclonatronaceae bacterium]
MSGKWYKLIKQEDWWVNWLGFLLLLAVFTGWVTYVPQFGIWADISGLLDQPYGAMLLLMIGIGLLCTLGMYFTNSGPAAFARAFPAVFVLAMVAFLIQSHPFMKEYGLGYALWALLIGLLISNTISVPSWMAPAVRSELYIKIGLVLLGARIVFSHILELGQYGIIVAWGVTPIVLILMFWFGWKYLKLSPEFSITISAATSVCGVSAAIAASESCRARKEELTLAVGMTLIFTVAMMVVMPLLTQWMGLNQFVAGAWIGGTIDSTGAVAAAGEFIGPDALATATVIKMIQNVMIGIIAFFIALFWVLHFAASGDKRPGAGVIWDRFPKFILGFIAASLVVSFILYPALGPDVVDSRISQANGFRSWFFCLAFLCIGLETDFRKLVKQIQGGKPLLLYLVGQTFNVLLTFLIAWLVFSNYTPD